MVNHNGLNLDLVLNSYYINKKIIIEKKKIKQVKLAMVKNNNFFKNYNN